MEDHRRKIDYLVNMAMIPYRPQPVLPAPKKTRAVISSRVRRTPHGKWQKINLDNAKLCGMRHQLYFASRAGELNASQVAAVEALRGTKIFEMTKEQKKQIARIFESWRYRKMMR